MTYPQFRSHIFLGLLAIVGAACGGGGDTPAAENTESPENTQAAEEASAVEETVADEAPEPERVSAGGAFALPALNLQLDVPAGSTVREMLGAQMISGAGVTLSIKAANPMSPADIEAARDQAEMYNGTNVSEETLDDGFVMTYQNTGGMGDNFFAVVRRQIRETAYMCESTTADAAQRDAAVAACRSLRAQ